MLSELFTLSVAVLIAAVLGLLTLMLYQSRIRLLRRARSNESKYRSIINAAIDGIITIDKKGTIHDCNPAVESIFGYRPEELVGLNISLLMPEPFRSQHDSYLRNYLNTGRARIIGIGREVTGLRRNGEEFPMDLAVSQFEWDGRVMFTGVVRDITERKNVERIKNEFVSTVSHELRTPLTSIRGALGLIRGSMIKDLPDAVRELITIADKNTERLLLLINDILDIQKIESGEVAFRFRSTGINALVQSAVSQNIGLSEQFNVKFKLIPVADEIYISVDPDRITQVIANLLSNAAKFSPEGETVTIVVARQNGGIRISVSDFGPGIPEEFRPRLFQKFSQLDSTDTRSAGGTGLGLAICRDIMERHNGHIDYVSHPGLGSTFFLDLPGEEARASAADTVAKTHQDREQQPCILIVEDDPDIAGLLQRMLAETGYRSIVAADADQARRILNQAPCPVRAITLDILLPGQDGISLLQDLRRQSHTREIPVIVVSARADETHRRLQGAALGIIDWLSKPIDTEQLRIALHQAIIAVDHPRILHVEDDEDIHRLISVLLNHQAHLDWAPDFTTARRLIEERKYDLALLDIGLPDGSGLDLIPALNDKGVRILVFSARNLSAEDAGRVQAVLTKANTRNDQLLSTIEALIRDKPPAKSTAK